MGTAYTNVFAINRSQAIPLPRNVALPDSIKEVVIIAIGNQRLITPVVGPGIPGSTAPQLPMISWQSGGCKQRAAIDNGVPTIVANLRQSAEYSHKYTIGRWHQKEGIRVSRWTDSVILDFQNI